jgi:type II secretory pathway pseudopilin PulG
MLISENKIGNLGIAPALVYAIFQAAVLAIGAGKSYYDSLQEARKQQREQRYLNDLELKQLAELLVNKYPAVSYSEWLDYVRATNQVYPPADNGEIPDIPKPKSEQNYWIYLVAFLAIMLVTKR